MLYLLLFPPLVYLDGLKPKDEIYSAVFGDIQNNLLNS